MTAVHHSEAGASAPVFRQLEGWCESVLSLPVETVADQVRANRVRGLPKLHESSVWKTQNGKSLAIVGGGPSLRKTLGELAEFPGDIMVCGSAHDFVVNSGIQPTYAVVCSARNDEGERPADFLKTPVPSCEYLIATCCHPDMFHALDGYSVTTWNNYFDEKHEEIYEGEPIVGGGSTVTLRGISLAYMIGYRDLHFFGLDSCFEDADENHAYDAGAHALEHELTRVRIGGPDGREFLTHIAWLVQARDFQQTLSVAGHLMSWTVHGDGMIAEIMKQAAIMAAKQQEN